MSFRRACSKEDVDRCYFQNDPAIWTDCEDSPYLIFGYNKPIRPKHWSLASARIFRPVTQVFLEKFSMLNTTKFMSNLNFTKSMIILPKLWLVVNPRERLRRWSKGLFVTKKQSRMPYLQSSAAPSHFLSSGKVMAMFSGRQNPFYCPVSKDRKWKSRPMQLRGDGEADPSEEDMLRN